MLQRWIDPQRIIAWLARHEKCLCLPTLLQIGYDNLVLFSLAAALFAGSILPKCRKYSDEKNVSQ
jgi:hypothetical protein